MDKLRTWFAKELPFKDSTSGPFVPRYGELPSRHIQIIVKRYGERVGIQGRARVSPHTLRYICATQYIRNGGDPFSLQEILGHSLEMVRNYVNLASATRAGGFGPWSDCFCEYIMTVISVAG